MPTGLAEATLFVFTMGISPKGQPSFPALSQDRRTSTTLTVWAGSESSTQAENLAKLARFYGLDIVWRSLEAAAANAECGEFSVVDIPSLSSVFTTEQLKVLLERILETSRDVLVLLDQTSSDQQAVARFFGGTRRFQLAGSLEASRVLFPSEAAEFNAELAGHCFPRFPGPAIGIVPDPVTEFRPVMKVGNAVSFGVVNRSSTRVYLWATHEVFDIERPLRAELEFERRLDTYVPVLIFLRKAFGPACWHAPWSGAGIVIDDPLITRRYGHLDFKHLLSLAAQEHFVVNLAFIPWNHWRTRKAELALFERAGTTFNICAHGCDHTNGEFITNDYSEILRRSRIAAARMDAHRSRTGMPWEPVMVCPREEYSREALRAIADSGRFLGLVNTGCIPRNADSAEITGADLLLPAQDFYFGFPIFKRHYSSDQAVFALAVFLGKPAILVEHHEFFRDECAALLEFVHSLRRLPGPIHWMAPSELARRTHLVRRTAPDAYDMRFFADEMIVQNPDSEARRIQVFKRIPADIPLSRVTRDGSPLPAKRDGDTVAIELELRGGDSARIAIVREPRPATTTAPKNDWRYTIGVGFRRFLSEFRDQVIARNDLALRAATAATELLTGKRRTRNRRRSTAGVSSPPKTAETCVE